MRFSQDFEMKYGDVKILMCNLFKNIATDIHCLTKKDKGQNRLVSIMNDLGIEAHQNKNGEIFFTIIRKGYLLNMLLDNLEYSECSICGKFKHSPRRNIRRDLYHMYGKYGELFEFEDNKICEMCFPPILDKWREQLVGIRDRWVKREHPDWGKTEKGYIDQAGHCYPL